MESNRFTPVVFRRWSNKKWAILASFHRVILIGTLCFSNLLLAQDTISARSDHGNVQMLMELEEVETSEEMPAQLEEVSLKPVILVTSNDISRAAASSPEELLEHLPQIDIRQRGKHGVQADLSIMGGSFDQSMVLLNGINISDPQTGHFHLNIPLDLHSVQQIEIVTGASARRYGSNAFSGAINLVTQPVDSTFLNAGFRYGQYHFYKGHLKTNLCGKNLSTQVSINASGSDGYRENTDFRTTHAFIHSATRPGKLRLHIMAGMNSRAFGANAFYSPRFIDQYEETSTGLAALKLVKRNLKTTWTVTSYFRLGRDHFLLDRHDPSFYSNDHLTIVGGVEISGKISTVAGITRTGLNYRREEIRSTSLGEPLDGGRWVKFNDTITFTHGHVRNQYNWNINHMYAWGPVTFSGGMLVHLNPDLDHLPRVYPGMDLKWRLPGLFSVYISMNQSMRMPTFTDLYYQGPSNVGNPLLSPERAATFELGIFRSYKGFYAGMNAFYRQGKDMIDWIWMGDEKWHTMNLTRVNAAGGDIQLNYRRPQSEGAAIRLESATLSYTFTHLTRVSHEVNSRYLLDYLRHKMVGGTDVSFYKRVTLSLKASYQKRNGSYMAFDAGTGQSVSQPYEAFILLDAKLTCSIWKIRLFAETTNLLDLPYHDIGNITQPGRWFIAGFEIR
ncbi:MAG: TonB-dependent receptor [Bacteroidetes bacterium]|nr:TonB-dependent receptor [Bacteroidota bacterium]